MPLHVFTLTSRPLLLQEFDHILKTSMLLILDPPAPDFLVPGFAAYLSGIEKLEKVATEVLQV